MEGLQRRIPPWSGAADRTPRRTCTTHLIRSAVLRWAWPPAGVISSPGTTPGMELLVEVEVVSAQRRRAMRWDERPRSDNVEDRRADGPRGMPMGRTGGIGIGTLIVLCLIGWALGINPLDLIEGQIRSRGTTAPAA